MAGMSMEQFYDSLRHPPRERKEKSAEFDMRPNIKAAPNSQGTLFRGGVGGMLPERRYPRGYTPQRMAEVKGSMGRVMRGPAVDDGVHVNPFIHTPSGHVLPDQLSQRLVHETIARSSVPARALRGLTVGLHEDPSVTERGAMELGNYHPLSQHINIFARRTTGAGHDTDLDHTEATLMHEVGHHLDMNHTQSTIARMATATADEVNAGLRGHLETNADANMIAHFRPHPGRRGAFDIHGQTYGQRGAAGAIEGGGYTDPSKYAQPKKPAQQRAVQGELF